MEEVKEKLTLKPVADELSEIVGVDVGFVENCIDAALPDDKDIVLLENVRFHAEEEANDDSFAKKLADLADIFVLDAFGIAHRSHASSVGVTKHLPSCAGFLMEKEVKELSRLLQPERPFVAIIGGAKKDKMNALHKILVKADTILVGGVLANTFLKASGASIGTSKSAKKLMDDARLIVEEANHKLCLPSDVVVADVFSNEAKTETVPVSEIPQDMQILDIGPKTIEQFKKKLQGAKTVLWAGPLGVFEMEKFSHGTKAIGAFLGTLDALTIAGGGDTTAAVEAFELRDKLDFVSTGGGASLEFIEKDGKLPGIIALEEAARKEE